MEKNKVLHLNSAFSIKSEEPDVLMIEGYASTPDQDRQGDVVPTTVWERGMKNYLRNPVILAYHDHSNPIGRMVEHKIDRGGLWIKARISNAAKTFQLIRDGVLTAFSVGFRVLDADYDSKSEAFTIKELELVEISVVSVPANQNTLFDLSKAFESPQEYQLFKEQFAPKGESAKGLESTTEAKSATQEEWNMNPEEIKQMLADAAKAAAEQATKALEAKQKAEEEAKAEEARRQAEIDARVKAAVEAHVQVGQSGAEKLLAEVTKRFEEERNTTKSALEGLEAALKEKAAELQAIHNSKISFADKSNQNNVPYEDIEKAVLLGKVTRKGVEGTKFGRELVVKYGGTAQPGQHLIAPVPWEQQVSLRMEEEIRRRLVMAPLMRQIAMQTNVMKMPLNPEAGYATWIQGAEFGNSSLASSGTAQVHSLNEITLSAFKVATKEYIAYEEEEDSLIILLPVIRDAMIRRVAKAVDRAMINGAGTNADPVRGLALYDTASAVLVTSASTATVASMRALRKDLGTWGLDPSELVFVVGNEVYYDLLEDPIFQTMDKVGDRATLLTGQVGSIGNTPVVVSGEMPVKSAGTTSTSTNIGAFCFAPGNFLVGNQRGLRIDTDDLVERQSRVLVASLRTGMTQLTTNFGPGVSTLRWN